MPDVNNNVTDMLCDTICPYLQTVRFELRHILSGQENWFYPKSVYNFATTIPY